MNIHDHQGQHDFEVKIIPEINCQNLDFHLKAGSWFLIECILVNTSVCEKVLCIYWTLN